MISKILCIILLIPVLGVASEEPGFEPLFDGKTLKGWRLLGNNPQGFVVENGMLVCVPNCAVRLYTEQEYANFVFRFEFRFEAGANNGVGIRAPWEAPASRNGMEIQIIDDEALRQKPNVKPAQYHGSIYDVIPARTGFLKPVGTWNEEEIRAEGRRITVKLNGTVIVNADLDSVTDPVVLQGHPGLARSSGHIGFLGYSRSPRVEFRNIRIKVLRP